MYHLPRSDTGYYITYCYLAFGQCAEMRMRVCTISRANMASAGDQMTKIDPKKDWHKLSEKDRHYMQEIERRNRIRVQALTKSRKKNRYIGGVLGVLVLGIYAYTLKSIRPEETYFDEDPKENVSK